MSSKIQKLRSDAYLKQNGRCYYCGALMWQNEPERFAATHSISLNNAKKSVTTGKAGGLKDCEPLKAVYSTDSLTTIRWSTI
ncbi:hypothetical protein [uncultured Desulfobulbus sp.]|uniref:hypothetical protein n=1 Tax=uncultured Desulfobulbus sp. TaxID=239745 RepID=UPI0029C7DB5A|nr:hypothetical protein [uncultured Desulfobulbus sp.]